MNRLLTFLTLIGLTVNGAMADDSLPISSDISEVTVNTDEGPFTITRQANDMQLIGGVLQPLIPVAGVHPMGELEVLEALNDPEFIVVDMRTIDWRAKSTIPGSIHIPYIEIAARLDELGCTGSEGAWDCSNARKVVAFCNGPACGQSPIAIRAMDREGYPTDKIYYYRGGMQSWTVMGLSVLEDAF
ncbi:rhodanese-like domain-containing protein [Reinekea forsetii]|nr:rhodanese-like domain-containing protein [Reinekea forsetii]